MAVSWAWSKGSGGFLGLLFAQVFFILGFVNTLTGAADLVTNRPETYYRRVDDYLFEVRFGVIALFIGILIAVYPFLPLVKKGRERKDTQARRIHEQYNAVHKDIEDRGYSWRNKGRMLAGKDPIDPLELTILIAVLVVIVIGLAVAFTSSVFG